MKLWKTSNKKSSNTLKTIKETKCTCSGCGNVWFYGKQDKIESSSAKMANLGKSMMCCSGCIPALLIPHRQEIDLKKCPKCGSKAVKKEEVIHNV